MKDVTALHLHYSVYQPQHLLRTYIIELAINIFQSFLVLLQIILVNQQFLYFRELTVFSSIIANLIKQIHLS